MTDSTLREFSPLALSSLPISFCIERTCFQLHFDRNSLISRDTSSKSLKAASPSSSAPPTKALIKSPSPNTSTASVNDRIQGRKVKILFLIIITLIHELSSKLGLIFHLLFLRYLSMVKCEQSTETFTTFYTAIYLS